MIDPHLASLCSVRAGLPPILPGAPISDRLTEGARLAGATLRKYTNKLDQFTFAKADQAAAEIEKWENANRAGLKSVFASGDVTALPRSIQAQLGKEALQNWVLSMYYLAAAYMAPHLTGAADDAIVNQVTINGQRVTKVMMDDDVETRLACFAIILKLDEIGFLKSVFRDEPAKGGANGVGELVSLTVIIIVTVIAAAAIVTGIVLCSSTRKNAELMEGLCKRAQETGDKETVKQCVAAAGAGSSMDYTPLLIGAGAAGTLFAFWKFGLFKRKQSA